LSASFSKLAIVACCATALSGCSMGGLLSGKRGVPSEQNVQVGNQLAMPPDLSLASPGTQAAPAQSMAAADSIDETNVLDGSPVAKPGQMTRKEAALAAGNPQGDIYDQYGISKLNPDGTKKEEWQLREELRKAIIAKKRKANPSYGTVMNIGGLFSDN
jgi:hypothetical protein